MPEARIVNVEARFAAVIRRRLGLADIPEKVMPLVDRVWAFLREREDLVHDHNVWLYHHTEEGLDVEVGVQVDAVFEGEGDVVCIETPSGRAAHVTHLGEYHRLPGVHQDLLDWCAARGLSRTGDDWEVYGDWDDDPTKRRTDVYHLLAGE